MPLTRPRDLLRRLLEVEDFPWLAPLPPWSDARDRQVHRVRRTARRLLRRRTVRLNGWPRTLAVAALWPAIALGRAARTVHQGRCHRRSPLGSLLDLFWLQLAYNQPIDHLDILGIADRAQRRAVRRFVNDLENTTLLMALNRASASREIGDKRAFAAHCARHDLPTVPVLAAGHGPDLELLADWPACDLFAKPTDQWGGHGACILRRQAATGAWQADDGRAVRPATLAGFAGGRFPDQPWILQPRVRNCAELGDLAPEDASLATVRVVTLRPTPGGPAHILCGFMKFPLRGKVVDNLSAGGIGADFDPSTGILGHARSCAWNGPRLFFHPETGGRIEGRRVPCWAEVVSLALRAHGTIPDLDSIGWDIALAEGGPILIEANLHWGVPVTTRLGDTAYVEFFLRPEVVSRVVS